MAPSVDIRPIPPAATAAIRHAVLWPALPPEAQLYDYDYAEGTVHLGAFVAASSEPVAVATLVRAPFARPASLAEKERALDACQLRKLAVQTDLQGKGIGTAMLAHVVALLTPPAGHPPRLLHFDARAAQAPFYEKLGYRVLDPEGFTKAYGGAEPVEYIRMGTVLR
ncbi:hypothetical protein Q8F55_003089 [Vanrija albida]|uniref:N-acetyltransferase domain-containing protein n=1 Tax=Vanrija albida TaxID=181172 RepID=A0ABR3QBQ4_9TREE